MKFYGGVLGSTMKKWLNFGGDRGALRWVNVVQVMIQNFITIIFYFILFIYLFTLFIFYFYLFMFFFFFFGGGGWLVFHHQGSTFLQLAIWE